MKALRNYLDKIKPNFEEGGKLAMFRSVFDGFETFLFVPNETSKTGVHIHDCIDSKRAMTVVIIALLPALLFGMYNVGYQHNLAVGAEPGLYNGCYSCSDKNSYDRIILTGKYILKRWNSVKYYFHRI